EAPAQHSLTVGVAALAGQQSAQVVQAGRNLGMLRAQLPLPDRERAPRQRLGSRIVALELEQIGQGVERARDVGRAGPQLLLVNGTRAPEQRCGARIATAPA